MNTPFKAIVLVVCATLFITSCSRKKDKFINRNFHAMGTKYNILYNGNIALEKGIADVNNAATDNYWDLLAVERMEVLEDVSLPGQSKNANFERAEEKAIKAVQKHGMNIKGREHNPQIDEAYLLLGQSRYFDQRFIPALEAFNYILYKHPTSDKINRAKVWREKTNIRLDNNELAIKNLKRLFEQEVLERQDYADAKAIMGQAYINIKAKDSALVELSIAAQTTKNHTEQARYNYIIGQLYNEFGQKDSANLAFDRIIDLHRKIPRAYYINAHLEKVANFDSKTGNKLEFTEFLTDLEEDRENRPFLDKIYYRIANYYRENESDSLAVVYYNKSLRKVSSDKYLKALDYSILGDMNFDISEYKMAGAYYDSTMSSMTLNSKPYRLIKRKRDNLDDVIKYEDIAHVNDSILNLVRLSDAERITFFEGFINDLKTKAEEAEKQKEIDARKNSGLATTDINGTALKPKGKSRTPGGQSFYFYNSNTVAYGKNEFVKIWGDRALNDNWRLSNKSAGASAVVNGVEALLENAVDEELYDPQFYISKIPTDSEVIDSIARERNFAYYQLGGIYKEKFNENELAKAKYLNLLSSQPEERLVLPSKYNLYKIYIALGQTDEAAIAKAEILTNYSNSRYAEILRNPNSEITKGENSPERLYEDLYAAFNAEKYSYVIEMAGVYISQFVGDAMVPKFEILKASANGRLYGFEAYKKGVNYIALTYPNTEEGKQAHSILQDAIPQMAVKTFLDDKNAKKFNVIYEFDVNDESLPKFVEKLDKAIAKVTYFDLKTSVDVYDENTSYVVVHGLKSIDGAEGFAEILAENKDKIDKEYFVISSANYAVIQRHKNVKEYLKKQ